MAAGTNASTVSRVTTLSIMYMLVALFPKLTNYMFLLKLIILTLLPLWSLGFVKKFQIMRFASQVTNCFAEIEINMVVVFFST